MIWVIKVAGKPMFFAYGLGDLIVRHKVLYLAIFVWMVSSIGINTVAQMTLEGLALILTIVFLRLGAKR